LLSSSVQTKIQLRLRSIGLSERGFDKEKNYVVLILHVKVNFI